MTSRSGRRSARSQTSERHSDGQPVGAHRPCTVLAVTGFREGEKRVKGDRQGSIRCLPCSDNRIDRLSSGVAVDCAGAPTIEAVRLVR